MSPPLYDALRLKYDIGRPEAFTLGNAALKAPTRAMDIHCLLLLLL